MRDGLTEGEGNGNDSQAERHALVRITKHKSLHLSRNQWKSVISALFWYSCSLLQALLVCPEPWLPVSNPKITFFFSSYIAILRLPFFPFLPLLLLFFLHLFRLIWQVRLCKQINRSHTNYMQVICSRSACLTLCQQLVILEFVFRSIGIALISSALFLFYFFKVPINPLLNRSHSEMKLNQYSSLPLRGKCGDWKLMGCKQKP